jgi:eukaryotic-like serine/threonine-protein kinase
VEVELETIEGPDAGLRRVLRGPGEFVVGRAATGRQPDVPLHSLDRLASRVHFVLAVGLDGCRARDDGSANGTWLVGRWRERRIRGERSLPDDCYIRAGSTLLRLRVVRSGSGTRGSARVSVAVTCEGCGAPLVDEALPGDTEFAARCPHLCDACGRARAGNGSAREVGGHLVLSLLGRGRMGAAWSAWQAETRRVVALKESRDGAAESARAAVLFEREIEIMAALRHPNLVALLAHGRDGDVHWFASELQAGGSAEDRRTAAGGSLPAEDAILIMDGALTGLETMHRAGFVHRDVKPSNILLSAHEGGIARLGDFGLAKRFAAAGFSAVTRAGESAGTCGYVAPEQAADFRSAGPRADVYSAGASLYRLLSGCLPHDAVTGARVRLDRRCPSVSLALAGAVEKALAPRPRDRWDSARTFRGALAEAARP